MLALVSLADRVPARHPLRPLKQLADAALADLSPVFYELYEANGRASVPPERLLKSMLLIALFSVRSERQFCEQLDYNLLFRWFLDMDMVEPSFDHSTFSRNRDRLLEHEVAAHRGSGRGPGTAQQRALLGRRFAHPGVGLDEELPTQGRRRRRGLQRVE